VVKIKTITTERYGNQNMVKKGVNPETLKEKVDDSWKDSNMPL
jgi:hypothetical protein